MLPTTWLEHTNTVLSERSQTQKARCDMYDDNPTKSTDLAPLEEYLSILQQSWVSSLYGCIHTYNLSNSKGRNKKARSSRLSLTLQQVQDQPGILQTLSQKQTKTSLYRDTVQITVCMRVGIIHYRHREIRLLQMPKLFCDNGCTTLYIHQRH